MRDMYNLYAKRSDVELRQMRSLKYLRMSKLIGVKGFFAEREELALREQIRAIDAELEKRSLQQRLFK